MSTSELDPRAIEGVLCHLESVLSARSLNTSESYWCVSCSNLAWVPIFIADILDMT